MFIFSITAIHQFKALVQPCQLQPVLTVTHYGLGLAFPSGLARCLIKTAWFCLDGIWEMPIFSAQSVQMGIRVLHLYLGVLHYPTC
jgi:hypothetical protein